MPGKCSTTELLFNPVRVNRGKESVRCQPLSTGMLTVQPSTHTSLVHCLLKTRSLAHTGLELLKQPRMTLNFWSYCLPPLVAYAVLGMKPRALCMLGKHSSNWTKPSVPLAHFLKCDSSCHSLQNSNISKWSRNPLTTVCCELLTFGGLCFLTSRSQEVPDRMSDSSGKYTQLLRLMEDLQ